MKKGDKTAEAAKLRKSAEEFLRKMSNTGDALKRWMPETDALKLIHEVEVHQVELEMQNEELIKARSTAENAAEKYAALYDFAPVGYLTLSNEGRIREINFFGAKMLGKDRAKLINNVFGLFVTVDTRPAFQHFLENVVKSKSTESCEITLLNKGKTRLYVHLSGIVSENGESCNVIMLDITERKIAEEALKASFSLNEATLDSIHNGILVVSFQGQIIKFNARFAEMWCVPADILSSGNDAIVLEFVLDQLSDPDGFLARVAELYEQPEEECLDFICFKDGRIFERISRPMYIEGESRGRVWSFLDITEAKKAEEAKENSEASIRSLIENVDEIFIRYDLDLHVQYISPKISNFINLTSQDFLGKTNREAGLPEKLATLFDVSLKKVFASGKTLEIEYEIEGKERFLHGESTIYPEFDSKGSLVNVVSITRDITERKTGLDALQASEEKYRRLFENAMEGIFQTTFEGEFVNVNPAFAKMFGYSNPDAMMKAVTNLAKQLYVHSGDRELIKKNLLEHGSVENFETELYRKNREPLWVLINARLSYSPDGKTHYIDGTMADISEYVRAVDKLKVTNDKLNRAQSVAHIGSWENHLQTNELQWSDEMYHIMGFPLNTPMNFSKAIKVFPPEDLARIQEAVSATLADNVPYSMDYRIYHGDGSFRYIHDEGEVIYDENEKPVMMFGTTQDITERKIAEEELRESESNYYTLFTLLRRMSDTMPDLVWAKDLTHQYIFANKAMCEKLLNAQDTDEPIGKTDLFFAQRERDKHKDNPGWHTFGELCMDSDTETLKAMKEMQFNEFGNVKGKFLYLDVHKAPLFNEKGELIGVVGSGRDITESKQAEEALRESEERFRSVTESANDAIITTNEQGMILGWNKSAERILGYTSEEMNNKDLSLIIPQQYGGQHSKAIKRIEQGGISTIIGKTIELKGLHKNGKEFPVELSLAEWKSRSGRYFSGIIRDISSRKKAEKAIRESEESLKDIFQTVKEGIAYTSLSGKVLSINPALELMVGIPKEKIINKNLLVLAKDFLTLNNMKKVAPILTDLIQGKDVEPFQFEFRNKILEINVTINRQSKMMTGVVRDITERMQTEMELIIAKEKADEGNKLKTAFLQNISHEIRTPMNAIVGFSRMLEKKDLPQEKLVNYTNIIINSSEQLLSIVNDILTISALETRQEKINIQRVSVDKIIVDLLEIFRIHPVNDHVVIKAANSHSDDDLEIDSDKTKIIQILTNLIANAQKFTHEGSIEFGYRKKKEELEFFVRDTGIGIREEMKELIFDRFRQADITISQGYGGTGLGLAISKGFVELLGGRIWVESELGKGSAFYFTIPCKPAS